MGQAVIVLGGNSGELCCLGADSLVIGRGAVLRHERSKLYNTQRWKRWRRQWIEAHPLCALCEARGKITAATVCDHVEPHGGDPGRFWAGPFQSLCKLCHDGAKAELERSGTLRGAGLDGMPLDPDHPWNR